MKTSHEHSTPGQAAASSVGSRIIQKDLSVLASSDENENGSFRYNCAEPAMTVHRWIERQAEKTPHAVAGIFEGTEWSYAELNDRSNRVANALRDRGVGLETVVGIFLQRSLEVLPALIGIFKTGAAYLPIDCSLPIERVQYLLKDAGASVVITEDVLVLDESSNLALNQDGLHVLDIRDALNYSVDLATALPSSDSRNLAYVIYTSGSTGEPKGVEIEHASLTNFLWAMQEELAFSAADVMVALSSPSFDISLFELLLPLVSGGTVVIAPYSAATNAEALQVLLEQHRVTVMLATPATWQLLVDSGWTGAPGMRAITGGEAISPSLARKLLARVGSVWNHYGPTETTVAATTYRVSGEEQRIPIGASVRGLKLFVLDEEQHLVAVGAVGELYIGGMGVARGYRNRPRLSAERFVSIINQEGVPERVYRTGDFVRQLNDGVLEFVGRVDNQTKLRGFRIELEEIEATLAQHKAVKECLVVAREMGDHDKRLVAFITTPERHDGFVSALREFLRSKLPPYMIPSAFVFLDAMPLTVNRKIDRHSLETMPVAQWNLPAERATKVSDPVIAELMHIWRDVLGLAVNSQYDNFFDVGGHSLLAARLAGQVHAKFGTKLPLAVLLGAPTIAELARVIQDKGWKPSWSPLVVLREGGRKNPLFCVHAIGGNVLEFRQLAANMSEDQPVYGVQARGLNRQELPPQTIQEMAADYVAQIRSVQPEGPYFLAGHSAGGVVAFEMARQLRQIGKKVELLALLDCRLSHMKSAVRTGQKRHRFKTREATLPKAFWTDSNLSIREKFSLFREAVGSIFLFRRVMFKVKLYLLLRRLGVPTGPLRSVAAAFAFAIANYQPAPYSGNVAVYRSEESDDVVDDPSLGWQAYLTGHAVLRKIPGGHADMLRIPNVRILCEDLGAELNAVSEVS
jgi:amino acid adenylation domain-containing protein